MMQDKIAFPLNEHCPKCELLNLQVEPDIISCFTADCAYTREIRPQEKLLWLQLKMLWPDSHRYWDIIIRYKKKSDVS